MNGNDEAMSGAAAAAPSGFSHGVATLRKKAGKKISRKKLTLAKANAPNKTLKRQGAHKPTGTGKTSKNRLKEQRNRSRKQRKHELALKREEPIGDKLDRYIIEVKEIENSEVHPIEKIDKYYKFLVSLYFKLQHFPRLQETLEVQIDATGLAFNLGEAIKSILDSFKDDPDVDDLIAMMKGLGVNNGGAHGAGGAAGVNMTKYTKKIDKILESGRTSSSQKIANLYKLLSDFDDNLMDSNRANLRDELAIHLEDLVGQFANSIRRIIHGLGEEIAKPNVKVDELALALGRLGMGF